jgi:hypothetical protein
MGLSESLLHSETQCEPLEWPNNAFHNLSIGFEGNGLLLMAGYLFDDGCAVRDLSKVVMAKVLLAEQHERLLSTRSHYRICRHAYRYSLVPAAKDLTYYPREIVQWSISSCLPHYFSVDLLGCSRRMIDFLVDVRLHPKFDRANLKQAELLLEDYLLFLILLDDNMSPEKVLVPSFEIQAVWLSHMLQSGPYEDFIKDHFPSLEQVSHPLTNSLQGPELEERKAETKKLWDKHYPADYCPYSAKNTKFIKLFEELQKTFTPEMVLDDTDWILEFKKFTYGTDVRTDEFLQKAHTGYQKFLALKYKYSDECEDIGFAPCPPIDLMWHSHLLSPYWYRLDMQRILGHIPKHKLLDLSDRTLVFMNKRDDEQLELWGKEFGECIFTYATV